MKMSRHTNFLHVVIFLVFVAAVPPNAARGQDDFLPSRSEVGAVMRQVNDYWIDRHPDPGDNLWAQSVYFIGNMAHYSATGKEEYLNYAVDWAVQHNWRINGCGTGVSAIADNQAAGQTFLALYQLEPDQAKVDCIINSINNNVHRYLMLKKQNKIIEDQWWHLRCIDELFMAMPVYAQLSVDYDDSDYLETMYALYRNLKITRGLYNADAGLWYRDEKFIPNEDDKDIFWSRGNGWAFAAHARILAILPESAPHYDEYRTTFQTMAAVLKAAQQSDGFWNVDLADANDFPGPETSGTALFTYGMAAGIGMGILDRTEYAETVTKAWNGMVHSAVHPDGKLGFIQGVAAQPTGNFTRDTTADFGVGAFLLAGSAIYSLTEDYGPANLALNRPVDCSSEPQGENGCAHTVDGDLVNRWSALSFPQWVEVDLGDVCLINGVSVHPYKSRAYRYYVEVKPTADDPYVAVVNRSGNTQGGLIITDTFSPVLARYIRLRIDSAYGYAGAWVSIREFEVFGGAPLALNRPVSCSSEPQGENGCTHTVDGDLVNRWSALSFPQWVEVDLGDVCLINGVSVHPYKSRAYQYHVEVKSAVDDPYVTVVNRVGNTQGGSIIADTFSPVWARHVRLRIDSAYGYAGAWVSIREFEVFGK